MAELDQSLEEKIEVALLETPGMTAREIGALLGLDKGDINSCLYQSEKFVKDDSVRPCWSLTGSLEQKIVIALRETPGMTAREIGALLGTGKEEINSCLYKSAKFVKDESTRPCWSLTKLECTPE